MTAIVCAAHADDEIIGVGGTIAKLAKKEDVFVIIFSYGANIAGRVSSLPLMMSEEELTKRRVFESKKAGDILGVKETYFLGLRGINLKKEFDSTKRQLLISLINKHSPDKLFFHSNKDTHPDHLFVNRVINEILPQIKSKPTIYTYQVNLFDFSEKDVKVVFDISDEEFKLKMKAYQVFKSQKIWTEWWFYKPMMLFKMFYFGKKAGVKYAEYFYSE